ncbi:hypothetical protein GL263_24585, partial [Streptomyces durbertensis]
MPPYPLLFLDVDGTLLPHNGVRLPRTLDEWALWQTPANPHLAALSPTHGRHLLTLPCTLVWATAWMHDANTVTAPRMGLPGLPVAALPEAPLHDEPDALHWKTRTLVETAAGRPFVWVDDEITDLDHSWVTTHHPGPALLHRVDPRTGLTTSDLTRVDAWLHQHTPTPQRPLH